MTKLDCEYNGKIERLQRILAPHRQPRQVRSNAVLAERRTDHPPTSPHRSLPECFHNHRSPLATALTDHLLDAFALTHKIATTASTDYLLGVFGLADNLEGQVQFHASTQPT